MFLHTKLIKFSVFLLVCLLSPSFLSAQNSAKIDSLTKILPLCRDDSTRTKVLYEIGRDHWFQRNLREAAHYLNQSVSLAEKCGTLKWQADALNLLANIYLKQEHYDSALNCLKKAVHQNDPRFMPLIAATYSNLYYQLGDYQSSLQYAFEAAEGYEKASDPMFNMQSVYVYLMIGDIFDKLKQDEKAIAFYLKAYNKGRTSTQNWYIKTPLLKIATHHLHKNEFEKARHLYDTIILIDKNSPSHEPTMHSYEGLGNIAMRKHEYSKSISYFRKGLRYAMQKKLAINIENFHTSLGAAFLAANVYDSATHYLNMAIKGSVQSKSYHNLSNAYKHLAALYMKQEKYSQVVIALELQHAYADSILNIEKIRTVNYLDIIHNVRDTEKKMMELLNTAQKAQQEKEFAIKTKNIYIAIGAGIVIILVVIMVLLKRNYRHRHFLQEEKVKHIEQQQHLISLQSMVNGQEAERTRIAKDLHDGLGGLFSTVKMHFSTLQHQMRDLKQNDLFQKSYQLVDTASVEVRRIAHNMMPEVLMKLGLINAVKDLCDNISAGKLLKVWLEVHGMEKRLNISTEVMLYRIIQELLNNIIKHAQATEAIIQFTMDGSRLSVVVEDNGTGFSTIQGDERKHAGIDTIKSRVDYLKGRLTIDSQKGVGTTVMMDFLIND